MTCSPYIFFDGNCKEALEFYASVFHLEVPETVPYSTIPDMPTEYADYILHATLPIAGGQIMFSDGPPGFVVAKGNNVAICLALKDKEEIKRICSELSEGGEILHPLGQTFFSELYCMFDDKFGIKWQLTME